MHIWPNQAQPLGISGDIIEPNSFFCLNNFEVSFCVLQPSKTEFYTT